MFVVAVQLYLRPHNKPYLSLALNPDRSRDNNKTNTRQEWYIVSEIKFDFLIPYLNHIHRMLKYTMLLLFERLTGGDVAFKFSSLHLYKLPSGSDFRFSSFWLSGSQYICLRANGPSQSKYVAIRTEKVPCSCLLVHVARTWSAHSTASQSAFSKVPICGTDKIKRSRIRRPSCGKSE